MRQNRSQRAPADLDAAWAPVQAALDAAGTLVVNGRVNGRVLTVGFGEDTATLTAVLARIRPRLVYAERAVLEPPHLQVWHGRLDEAGLKGPREWA